MDIKLTLSLNKSVIAKAKEYAKEKSTSLSAIIENYLSNLTATDKQPGEEISPLVKSLSGVLHVSGISEVKKGYTDYLSEKYK